jgi:hypothetical protein
MKNFYKPGVWNVLCDVCGFKFKSDQIKQRWDGLLVCEHDWEPRHPQDLLRATEEHITVPFSRPDPALTYFVCTIFNSVGIAGVGVAGCAVAGRASLFG